MTVRLEVSFTSEVPCASIIRLLVGTSALVNVRGSIVQDISHLVYLVLLIGTLHTTIMLWFNYVLFEMIGQVAYGFPIVLLMFYYWFSTYLSITVRGIRELCYEEHRWISPTKNEIVVISHLREQHTLSAFPPVGIFPCSLYVCVL